MLLKLTGLLALPGPLVGLAWVAVTPRAGLMMRDGGYFLLDPETKAFVAADGWFAVLGAAVGLLSGALAWWRWRRHGVAVALAAVVGGTLGALLAWRVGHLLGPPALAGQAPGPGGVRQAPLQLRARGVLLAWPIAALLPVLVLTAATNRPARRRPRPQFGLTGWRVRSAAGREGRRRSTAASRRSRPSSLRSRVLASPAASSCCLSSRSSTIAAATR